MTDYINRPIYIEKIKPFIGKSLIKVLVGQRRVGKSYLLMQLKELIKAQNTNTQIIYINKELNEFSSIRNSDDLFCYLEQNVKGEGKVALFIDEIQDIESFEVTLRDLVTRKNYDIYCTGSNANLLSGELTTLLSGRYIEIKVFCLSYAEFLNFNKIYDSVESFKTYIMVGGLPYLINLSNEIPVAYEYITSIYNTILLKDVVARFNVRNVKFLENLVQFLSDNLGSIVSSKKISEYLKSQKINISTQVVIDYLGYLESSFLISKVKRSGIEGKKIFEIGEKYFFEDIGIRNAIVGYKSTDINKILENTVYLHLRIAGYSVTVGMEGDKEIDFVAQKAGNKIYVQVAYMLTNKDTINREFGNLLKIPDNFPKYVVTMDEITETTTYKGITRMNIRDFCLYLASE
ncbi:MAG: ATP-binding protein [Bacteroidales bacterium]|nr:ATP-binding protein [Bacteroidales bacterium]MDD2425899.1 ATP-binding protein [Bacteroidales bacterium]MDD3990145.1 ATP-binding protein [Bacteroidales bacterium]MDD4638828.1 ATP-binding protein [Bacteroidales bacterium]